MNKNDISNEIILGCIGFGFAILSAFCMPIASHAAEDIIDRNKRDDFDNFNIELDYISDDIFD